MSDVTVRSCATCAYWVAPDPGGATGLCRRFPPVPDANGNIKPLAYWPRSKPTDWCGEHKERS
jgi:hypothetical protein